MMGFQARRRRSFGTRMVWTPLRLHRSLLFDNLEIYLVVDPRMALVAGFVKLSPFDVPPPGSDSVFLRLTSLWFGLLMSLLHLFQ